MLAGCASHFTKWRTSAPWSCTVCSQSIQGRRLAASTGPVAPRISIGTRSHQAFEDGHGAVEQPDIGMQRDGHRLTPCLGIAMGEGDGDVLPCRQSRMRGAELPRWFTRLSCSPRKEAPGLRAIQRKPWARRSSAIASDPQRLLPAEASGLFRASRRRPSLVARCPRHVRFPLAGRANDGRDGRARSAKGRRDRSRPRPAAAGRT